MKDEKLILKLKFQSIRNFKKKTSFTLLFFSFSLFKRIVTSSYILFVLYVLIILLQ